MAVPDYRKALCVRQGSILRLKQPLKRMSKQSSTVRKMRAELLRHYHAAPLRAPGCGASSRGEIWQPGPVAQTRGWLPEMSGGVVATLGQDVTPPIEAPQLTERVGTRLYLTFEGMNLTASFTRIAA